MKDKMEYKNCDRCDTKNKKSKLQKQDGLWVCTQCFDQKQKTKPVNMKWGTPRSNHLTTTAVYSPIVFNITAAAGITPSHSYSTESSYSNSLGVTPEPSFGTCYYMQVSGTGGVDIIANPQISAGRTNDKLTLEGTSDTDFVTLDNGTGLSLINGESFTLGLEDKIILVFDGTNWKEVSRYKELNYT